MLLVSIVSNIVIPNATSSSPIYMVTNSGLPQYSDLIVFGFIIFLLIKESLSASNLWNDQINNSFNLAIPPLLLTVIAIAAYKIMMII